MDKRQKIFLGSIIAFVVLLISGIIGISIWYLTNNALLNIAIAPSDSEVFINGEKSSSGERRITPGLYEIMVARDGFEPQTKNIQIDTNTNEKLIFILESNSPDTENWYFEHPEDARLLEGSISWQYDSDSEVYNKQNNILHYLPFVASAFSVGYGNCTRQGGPDFCLVIKSEFGAVSKALDYIRHADEKIGKYYIEYINYGNIFSSETISLNQDIAPPSLNRSLNIADIDDASISQIINIVNDIISRRSEPNVNIAELMQLKCFDSNYCAAKIKVTRDEYNSDTIFDIYRIIVYKNNDTWLPVSVPDFAISYYKNPRISTDLIDLANDF
ncbi:hypothetical protein IJ135_00705 [Candidatus Saccharibacteria bacterium]|nr:hypothetical protein [Candidatus Saccharibacteria bacterium]